VVPDESRATRREDRQNEVKPPFTVFNWGSAILPQQRPVARLGASESVEFGSDHCEALADSGDGRNVELT